MVEQDMAYHYDRARAMEQQGFLNGNEVKEGKDLLPFGPKWIKCHCGHEFWAAKKFVKCPECGQGIFP